MSTSWRTALAAAVTAAVALGGAAQAVPGASGPAGTSAPAGVQPSTSVPQPTVSGPVTGGIRTGEPFGRTMVPLDKGWVEEEFFFEGTARTLGATEPTAAYKSRLLVRRPSDPKQFNGTVVLDWDNVTLAFDKDVSWAPSTGR